MPSPRKISSWREGGKEEGGEGKEGKEEGGMDERRTDGWTEGYI